MALCVLQPSFVAISFNECPSIRSFNNNLSSADRLAINLCIAISVPTSSSILTLGSAKLAQPLSNTLFSCSSSNEVVLVAVRVWFHCRSKSMARKFCCCVSLKSSCAGCCLIILAISSYCMVSIVSFSLSLRLACTCGKNFSGCCKRASNCCERDSSGFGAWYEIEPATASHNSSGCSSIKSSAFVARNCSRFSCSAMSGWSFW